MKLPGFTAECSLSETSKRYVASPTTSLTVSIVHNSDVMPAVLARQLSPDDMKACYFACRSGLGGLGHAFCAASCF
jgi:hypothetical protein